MFPQAKPWHKVWIPPAAYSETPTYVDMNTTMTRPDVRTPHPQPDIAFDGLRSWIQKAACAGSDPDWWFPNAGTAAGKATAKKAIAICRGCPVRQQCHEYARETKATGIWGGYMRGPKTVNDE